MGKARSGHAAAAVGEDIYVCGGNDGTSILKSASILDWELR